MQRVCLDSKRICVCNKLHTVPTRCHKKIKGGKAELPKAQQVIVDLEDTWALKRCVFCQNSTGSDLVWNRDRNASLNIVGIYLPTLGGYWPTPR